MTTVLQTPRAALREFTESDLDPLAKMVADQDQMAFYPRPKTRDEAKAWIARNLSLYQKHGYGFWLMEAIERGEFLGYDLHAAERPLHASL
jgi:RimJ/RimL family protein N-acetyltransferase